MIKIQWNEEKSIQIQKDPNRGVSLELIAELIQAECYLDIIAREKYPEQKAFVVPINDQVWCVPFNEGEGVISLITAWPDRKLRRKYYGKDE